MDYSKAQKREIVVHKPERTYLFLATNLKAAHEELVHLYNIHSYKGPDRGLLWWDGLLRPFKIVINVEGVRGLRLCGFSVLPHAEFGVTPYMVALARMNLR